MKKLSVISILIIIFLLIFLINVKANETSRIVIDFEQFELSSNQPLTRQMFRENGINTSNWDNNLSTNGSIKAEPNGNKYLSIFSPEGSYGPKKSGLQTEIQIDPGKEYYMQYDLMFDENFSFGSEYRGGKLPGLTSGARCSGACDGTDGFAARFMWRRNGEGEVYLCHLDQVSEFCDDYYFTDEYGNRFEFEKGKKYTISEYIRLNTDPQVADGQIKVEVDGIPVLDISNIRLVTNDDKIDTFYLSMFYGGSTSKWAASNDSYVYIDNIYLYKIN
ncbi:hypothetical protein R2F61_01370 [Mollicutes bacterium LVI A0078]|nr:hypothetical protein RZE84_01365 [Mollicutes bacterium LVI A0075]WOO91228.1 hypothetical protein R2F61_01370 [Mollicutes bacterium LVI A0078]